MNGESEIRLEKRIPTSALPLEVQTPVNSHDPEPLTYLPTVQITGQTRGKPLARWPLSRRLTPRTRQQTRLALPHQLGLEQRRAKLNRTLALLGIREP